MRRALIERVDDDHDDALQRGKAQETDGPEIIGNILEGSQHREHDERECRDDEKYDGTDEIQSARSGDDEVEPRKPRVDDSAERERHKRVTRDLFAGFCAEIEPEREQAAKFQPVDEYEGIEREERRRNEKKQAFDDAVAPVRREVEHDDVEDGEREREEHRVDIGQDRRKSRGAVLAER